MRKILLVILFALLSCNAHASSYQVEMIIFEHLYPDVDSELWHTGQKLPDLTDSIELGTDHNSSTAFQVLPAHKYILGNIYGALKTSKSYRPLLHIAWQQPALTSSRAESVHIRKVEGVSEQDNFQDAFVKVDGIVRIRASTFLHADVDLAYFFQSVPASQIAVGNVNTDPQRANFVRLTESRRMKLNELHYFDHPLFGVVMRVSRFGGE